MLDYLMPVKVGLHLITLQSSEFLNKMTFVHNYEATCVGVVKRTQTTVLKIHLIPGWIHTSEQD